MTNSYDLSAGAKRLEKVEASPIRTILDRAAVLRSEGKPVIPFSAGEPDFNTPTDIKEATIRAITNNQTKYTSNRGYPALRKVLKEYIQRETGMEYDPETEILVTSSAAEALNNTIMSFVDDGDEVIVLNPRLHLLQVPSESVRRQIHRHSHGSGKWVPGRRGGHQGGCHR